MSGNGLAIVASSHHQHQPGPHLKTLFFLLLLLLPHWDPFSIHQPMIFEKDNLTSSFFNTFNAFPLILKSLKYPTSLWPRLRCLLLLYSVLNYLHWSHLFLYFMLSAICTHAVPSGRSVLSTTPSYPIPSPWHIPSSTSGDWQIRPTTCFCTDWKQRMIFNTF